MMNLTGPPDIAVQVGRKASWVATRESTLVPLMGREFFYYHEHSVSRRAALRPGVNE